MPLAVCRDCFALAEPAAGACARCRSGRIAVHEELDALDIAHIDCDAFYAAVEKRDNPALLDKPVIVGHPGGRGVVTTACYVARKFGPRSAMPMFKALRLCPDAVVIPPDMAKYKRASIAIRGIFAEVSDCIEPVSLDEAYLDLTDAHRMSEQPPAPALAAAQSRIEREVGITVSIGLSYNKFLAKLASDLTKPRGYSVIGRAEARDFVAGLPVGRIHGVGDATAERMLADGFELVSDLQALSEREMIGRFGKFGRRLFKFVNAEDDRRVTPDRASKSVSAEDTFARDTADFNVLEAELGRLCQRVAERLQRSGLAGRCVVLKLKTGDFQILTRNRQLTTATLRADVLFEHGRALLAREADGRAFRLIGIAVADLVAAGEADPPDLFSLGAAPNRGPTGRVQD